MTINGKHRKVSFGKCQDDRQIKAYARKEGFLIISAHCQKCNGHWSVVARPDDLPRLKLARRTPFLFNHQTCPSCGHDVVFAKKT